MNTKHKALLVGSFLLLTGAREAGAASTPLPLRCEANGVYIHGGVTSQTIEPSFGTNLLGLAFTGTTTYDFYSPPLSAAVNLTTSDKGGGVIFMANSGMSSTNDVVVTGRMQYFDYDPVSGTETMVADTTTSPAKNVNHGQTASWAVPNASSSAAAVIPAGHMLHIAMTIGLVSGDPGNWTQVLYNGPSGTTTTPYFPQNRSVALAWPILSGPPTVPTILSINLNPVPAAQISCCGTPGTTYLIQATTNLCDASTWTTISTNVICTNGLCLFIDADAANYPCRFYRATTP